MQSRYVATTIFLAVIVMAGPLWANPTATPTPTATATAAATPGCTPPAVNTSCPGSKRLRLSWAAKNPLVTAVAVSATQCGA